MTPTMFYIFEHHGTHGISYLFTTNEWFSGSFDSLQQLCEVGVDDPSKVIMENSPRIDHNYLYQDCKFLFQTTNLETAHLDYPEWFI